jgi:MFS family permease
MRRLVTLVSVLVFVDTTLFAALTPLLGRFAHVLHLSTATAGVLVAAYAAGALLGSLPGGVTAARLGPRQRCSAAAACSRRSPRCPRCWAPSPSRSPRARPKARPRGRCAGRCATTCSSAGSAWALGAIAGPAGAGVLADATGEGVPFALALLGCLACFGVIARRSRSPLARTRMGG